jgi:DNA polymerase (family 10)
LEVPTDRKQIAAALREIARLSELRGENPFKCRAFDQAARAIERLNQDLQELVDRGKLTSIRGIGKGTALQITHLLDTGHSPLLEELRAFFPEGLRRLLRLPGLGPKRLRVIHEKLGVTSVGELEYAIVENRLRDLPGFGTKSQEALRKAIEILRRHEGRFLLPVGWRAATTILIERGEREQRVEIAGELRRQLETLSEVVLIAEGESGRQPSEHREKTTDGIPYRLLVRPAESFEGSWLWESSSESHRKSLQERAGTRGLTFDATGLRKGQRTMALTEEEIYRKLDLPPVHPLLREEAATELNHADSLAGPESIRGIFHVHTTDSDGVGSVEEMVTEAKRMGYQWIGISDHSQSAVYANGLSPERLRQQKKQLAQIQKQLPEIRILHGVESDILSDGSLDYDDDLLDELDFVVASVHGQFGMDPETMTKRIERALRHPATTHWGHPTGRLLLAREGYACDLEHLLKVCAEEGVSVEFNANPHRLDLDWRWIPLARTLEIPLSINPDAHTPEGLSDARLTVGTAAKGGLQHDEPLNNRTPEEISDWLREGRRRERT